MYALKVRFGNQPKTRKPIYTMLKTVCDLWIKHDQAILFEFLHSWHFIDTSNCSLTLFGVFLGKPPVFGKGPHTEF